MNQKAGQTCDLGCMDETAHDGPLPVLQWEINPDDPTAGSVETSISLDGQAFHLWWQLHRGGDLVYASLRSMRGEPAGRPGPARPHPVGYTDAVNLVYDRTRKAVLAIYGTVRDFRPFVEAFRRAYTARTGETMQSTSQED